jgi:xylulokinase
VRRALLVGGGARSPAVCDLAPRILGMPVLVPPPGEYVAIGAARQAAWCSSGATSPPRWAIRPPARHDGAPLAAIRARYHELRELTATRTVSKFG